MLRKIFLSTLTFLLIYPALNESAVARTINISCDSQNNRTQRCPVNARGRGQVRLTRTRSGAPCNGNWEYRDGDIFVRNGCRGDFQVTINDGNGNDDDFSNSDRFREFGNVPRIGRFIVDRRSYYNSRDTREFDAIVNGNRERWWATCRGGDLGTDNREVRQSRETDRIVDFVCKDTPIRSR